MNNKNAITLSELLIATTLVGVVMVGVAAMDFAVQHSHSGTTETSVLAAKAAGMMLQITKDADKATGNAINLGINVTADRACFRQDTATPNDYTDDTWVCYNRNGIDLRKCTFGPPTPPGDCTGTYSVIGQVTSSPTGFNPLLTNDAVNKRFWFEVQLITRRDPSGPASLQDNPEYRLVSRISPESHSY